MTNPYPSPAPQGYYPPQGAVPGTAPQGYYPQQGAVPGAVPQGYYPPQGAVPGTAPQGYSVPLHRDGSSPAITRNLLPLSLQGLGL